MITTDDEVPTTEVTRSSIARIGIGIRLRLRLRIGIGIGSTN